MFQIKYANGLPYDTAETLEVAKKILACTTCKPVSLTEYRSFGKSVACYYDGKHIGNITEITK